MTHPDDGSRTTMLQVDALAVDGSVSIGEDLTWTRLDHLMAIGTTPSISPLTGLRFSAEGASPVNDIGARESLPRYLPPGERLGRFRVVRPLGRGGTGSVYEAIDLDTDAVVAVKVLHRVLAAQLVSFKAEFRVACRVAHANLVTPLELTTDGARWLIVLELVRGRDFIDWLTSFADGAPHAVDEGQLRACFCQLLDGLEALHAAEIVHRDLKPSNVLVTADGQVRIVDFGLAVLRVPGFGWVDARGRVVGSPAYMAPEQVAAEPITAAADLYSVGVMLFEALTGELPFAGPPFAMMMGKLTLPAPDPRALASAAPAELATLARALLARDPSARPHLAEVRERLRAEPRPARQSSRPPPHELVGRDRELHELDEAFHAVAEGPLVVHLEGSSGVGKTALLEGFLASLRAQPDTLLLTGRCHQLERIPYKGIDGAVDQLRDFLLSLDDDDRRALLPDDFAAAVTMFPVLSDVGALGPSPPSVANDEIAERTRAHAALHALLSRISSRRRIVIALDDVQWGDVDGARLLQHLLIEAPSLRVLFVFCFRAEDAESSALLGALHGTTGQKPVATHRRIVLERLPLHLATELARRLLPSHDAAQAEQIARDAGGEPFLVEQLALSTDPFRAGELREVVRARASRLGRDAVRLLEVISLVTQPIPERLAGLCIRVEDPRPLCAQLTALSLVRGGRGELGTTVVVYHDRLRDAVLSWLDDEARRRLHLELASVGERELLLPPHALADQFERGGASERAAAHAFAAGQQAERSLAFDLAVDMFARAAALAGQATPLARRARAAHAHSLHLAGRCSEAGEAFMRVRADATGNERHLITSRAVDAWLSCGRVDRAFDVIGPLLEAAHTSYPEGTRALVTGLVMGVVRAKVALAKKPRIRKFVDDDAALRADLLWAAGKGLLPIVPAQGAVLAFRSVFPALASGDPHRIGRSLAFLGSRFVPLLGRESDRSLRWARELADTYDDPHLRLMIGVAESARGLLSGDWEACTRAARQVLAQAPKVAAATTWEQAMAHTLMVAGYEYQGELAEMERACLACLRDVRARGDQITAVTVVSAHGYVRAAQHDALGLDELIDDMETAMHGWTAGAGLWDFYVLRLKVLRALCWGEPARARAILEAEWPRLKEREVLRMPVVRGPALITRVSVLVAEAEAEGDREAPARRAEILDLIGQLRREPRDDACVHAAVCAAALAEQVGRADERDRALAEAEDVARAADLRIVFRMIGRLRAILRGETTTQRRLEEELEKQGVVHPEAWARFVTPGWSRHAQPSHRGSA